MMVYERDMQILMQEILNQLKRLNCNLESMTNKKEVNTMTVFEGIEYEYDAKVLDIILKFALQALERAKENAINDNLTGSIRATFIQNDIEFIDTAYNQHFNKEN